MIRTEQLSFQIGDFKLQEISLEIATGEYFVLLGPPGSGKSVLLECLCGLNAVDSGSVFVGDKEITSLEPGKRPIGYVPQDYALFPHLSVERNIGFGLRCQGWRRAELDQRVTETMGLLGIDHLSGRRIKGLSGGERQRVSLARALVLRPQILLLDEPVSALDESTREEVCEHLLRLHRQLGLTTIHVSHNQEEAFSIADRAGILQAGCLRQVGTMPELLRRPCSEFVARFMRCENIFHGEAADQGQGSVVQCGSVQLRLPGQQKGAVAFMIRPEDVQLFKADGQVAPQANEFPVALVRDRDFGHYVRLTLNGDLDLVAHISHGDFLELNSHPESSWAVRLPPENIHLFSG